MNNIKLLKEQCNLALSMIDERARIGIDNYIAALELQIENTAKQKICFTCGGPVNTSTGYLICENGCGGPVASP